MQATTDYQTEYAYVILENSSIMNEEQVPRYNGQSFLQIYGFDTCTIWLGGVKPGVLKQYYYQWDR